MKKIFIVTSLSLVVAGVPLGLEVAKKGVRNMLVDVNSKEEVVIK